jgi:hypothetical protein
MLQINKTSLTVVVCCTYLMMVSCKQGASNLSATPSNYSPPMSIATLQAYPTPMNVFEYPGQVTDGSLLFSINAVNVECSKIGDSTELVLTFGNLTDKTINLPADFSIAVNRRGDGGNIIPFIANADEVDVFTLGDFQLVDIFNMPSNIYREIPANQSVDFTIGFRFPKYLVQATSNETIDFATPVPGQYFIRFVYSEYKRDIDAWHGAIGSNRIEICILN